MYGRFCLIKALHASLFGLSIPISKYEEVNPRFISQNSGQKLKLLECGAARCGLRVSSLPPVCHIYHGLLNSLLIFPLKKCRQYCHCHCHCHRHQNVSAGTTLPAALTDVPTSALGQVNHTASWIIILTCVFCLCLYLQMWPLIISVSLFVFGQFTNLYHFDDFSLSKSGGEIDQRRCNSNHLKANINQLQLAPSSCHIIIIIIEVVWKDYWDDNEKQTRAVIICSRGLFVHFSSFVITLRPLYFPHRSSSVLSLFPSLLIS